MRFEIAEHTVVNEIDIEDFYKVFHDLVDKGVYIDGSADCWCWHLNPNDWRTLVRQENPPVIHDPMTRGGRILFAAVQRTLTQPEGRISLTQEIEPKVVQVSEGHRLHVPLQTSPCRLSQIPYFEETRTIEAVDEINALLEQVRCWGVGVLQVDPHTAHIFESEATRAIATGEAIEPRTFNALAHQLPAAMIRALARQMDQNDVPEASRFLLGEPDQTPERFHDDAAWLKEQLDAREGDDNELDLPLSFFTDEAEVRPMSNDSMPSRRLQEEE